MSSSAPAAIPWGRLLAILGVFVYLQVGPVQHQLLGYPKLPGFKSWKMYRTFGTDICRVRFMARQPDGTVEELDRWEALQVPFEEAKPQLRFIRSEAQVARTGETMCRRSRHRDVRAEGDCGSRFAWRPMARIADVNLCVLGEPDFVELERRR